MLRLSYWILVFVQVFSFRTAGIGPSQRDTYFDLAARIRIATTGMLLALLLAMFLLRLLPHARGRGLVQGQKALVILGAYMVLCTFWSPLPLTAVFRLIQLGAATAIVWYFLATQSRDSLHDVVWALCLPVLIAGILNGLFAPGKLELYQAGQIAFIDRFKENACGHIAAIAAAHSVIALIWRPTDDSRWRQVFRLVLSLAALTLFRSATGWILLLLAAIVIAVRARKFWLVALAMAAVLFSLLFFSPLDIGGVAVPGSSQQKIRAVTDRLGLYQLAIGIGLESPYWGHGYLADSLLPQFETELGWVPQNAHNGFLSAFLNFGFIGLVTVVFAFHLVSRGLRGISAGTDSSSASVLAFELKLVLLLVAVGNLLESWVGDRFTLLWPIFIGLGLLPALMGRNHFLPQRATQRGSNG